MRPAFSAIALALLLAVPGGAPHAEQVKLPDGTWPSLEAYFTGLWKWDRPEPRQTAIERMAADGTWYFHNFNTDLQHWGRWRPLGNGEMLIQVTRTCAAQATRCNDHNPPVEKAYPMTPTTADVFMAGSERWERVR